MNAVVEFLVKHGYPTLFAAIFAHQLGLPIPGPLFLLAAGALAAGGKMGFTAALIISVFACVLADWPWYEVGRRDGDKVLRFLHRLTPHHDTDDDRPKKMFARFGPPLLLLSKFVPGMDAVMPPLAGASRTSRIHFLGFDALGSALYAIAYAGLGYLFCHDLVRVASYAGRAGTVLGGLALGGVVMYVAHRLVNKHCCQRKPSVLRLTPPKPEKSQAAAAACCSND